MPSDIANFIAHYCDAFNRLDGGAVADFYLVPSVITDNDRYTVWSTRDEIVENMIALCELYRAKGFTLAEYEVEQFIQQGSTHAIVNIAWVLRRSASNGPWQFHTTYNLRRAENEWKILVCTAFEERLNA